MDGEGRPWRVAEPRVTYLWLKRVLNTRIALLTRSLARSLASSLDARRPAGRQSSLPARSSPTLSVMAATAVRV